MHSPFPADTLIFAAVFAVIRTVRAVLLAVLGRILGIILRVLILGIPVQRILILTMVILIL